MITSHNFQGKYLRKISLNWPPRMINDSVLYKHNFRFMDSEIEIEIDRYEKPPN